jgi:GNAT superfamily N-acetyltransferase
MGEFSVAAAIMTEAAEWLIASGQPLWPLEEVSEERLRAKGLAPESVLVGYSGEEPAVAASLEWRDEMFWPGVTDAGFVHKLAVRRSFSGQGLPRLLLNWCTDAAAANGKEFLRLDCLADRESLCSFYESCGFVRVGSWRREPFYDNALYALRIGG